MNSTFLAAWPSLPVTTPPETALVPVPPWLTTTPVKRPDIVFHRFGSSTAGTLAPVIVKHMTTSKSGDVEPGAWGPNGGGGMVKEVVQPQPAGKIFTCEFCSKMFGFPSKLQEHMRSHTKETPFQCPFCPKGFTQKGNYKRHVQLHSEQQKDGS
ncbi:sal-like protein 2 [Amblyomma americanum]